MAYAIFDTPAIHAISQAEVAKLTGRELWLLRLWPMPGGEQTGFVDLTDAGGDRLIKQETGKEDERTAAIRAWAKSRGLKVRDQGPLPASIIAMYDAAH